MFITDWYQTVRGACILQIVCEFPFTINNGIKCDFEFSYEFKQNGLTEISLNFKCGLGYGSKLKEKLFWEQYIADNKKECLIM